MFKLSGQRLVTGPAGTATVPHLTGARAGYMLTCLSLFLLFSGPRLNLSEKPRTPPESRRVTPPMQFLRARLSPPPIHRH